MKRLNIISSLLVFAVMILFTTMDTGCAQLGAPTGGAKDTIPPRLLKANPENRSVNVTGNKISLSFDEYVEVRDVQNNVLMSPLQKSMPQVDHKLKTVTVKLKDSLLPNTTYTINFGDAIVDLNESNPLKNFTYTFSTGSVIDSLTLTGKVMMAESGLVDSTLVAMLYRDANDSAVLKRRPDYIAKIDGSGRFTFNNLPSARFSLFALLDGDGGKTYNSLKEPFAFAGNEILVNGKNEPASLFAYVQEKDQKLALPTNTRTFAADKKLRYTSSLGMEAQGLLDDIYLNINRPLKNFDTSGIILTDTNFKAVTSATVRYDTAGRKFIIKNKWPEETSYRLIINKEAAMDSAGNYLAKSDTLRFITKKISDYGNVVLRFPNIDLSKKPVLQIVQNNEVKYSYPLSSKEWTNKLFNPGEYELRILFDENNNGTWDPGNYSLKKQPEKVMAAPQKLSVKANWDNERDIVF